MSTGKVSNAIRCLFEEMRRDVFSLTEKVGMKTVLDFLREKRPKTTQSKFELSSEH